MKIIFRNMFYRLFSSNLAVLLSCGTKNLFTYENTISCCWSDFGQIICLSVPSMIIPSGYNNDYKSHHPKIKGGLFIILNYLVNMSILGVSLGYVILNRWIKGFFQSCSFNIKYPFIQFHGNLIEYKWTMGWFISFFILFT